MFAAALKESDSQDRAKRDKARQEQEAAAARAAAARAQADALATAKRDLERAIQAVRDAKRNGKSTVEADAAWKSAKARVIELETGAAPTWAPVVPSPDAAPGDGAAEPDGDSADPSPVDDGSIVEEQA